MENKLFIGSLPFQASEDEFRAHFEQAGAVKSATIIKDRDTGRSKGFGFVEMETAEDALKAIEMLNGQEFKQRALVVNLARPREDRPAGGGGGRGGFGGGGGGNRGGGRGGFGGGGGGDRRPRY